MKFIKSHYFKIVMLFIAIGSMAFLYWYGFYKKYEEKYLPQNADAIAILDVKNIRNHFVFSNIKNPSGWEWNTTRVSTKKKFDLSDFGIKTSDYVTFFHMENQPYTQWFVTMELEDESIFEKTVTENHFSRTKLQNGMSLYYSNALHLCLIRYLNQILVSNIEAKQKQIAIITAEDLFLKKHFLDTKRTEKMIGTTNAVTFWVKKNRLLEEDGILNLKLEEDEITVEGQLHFKSKFQKEWQFTQNSNALVSLGFDFEMIRDQKLITENTAKINKMIGIDLDSILAYSPNRTELVLNKMIEKKDSSISYGYDEDFNPIKKVVVHTNREPSFHFSMQTANSKKLFDYLKNQNVIDNQDVFVNFPLARTKAFVNASSLKLEANPLKKAPESSAVKIGYLQIQFGRLYPNDWRFILAKNKNIEFLKSLETLEINLSKENNLVHFRTSLKTKEGKKLISVMK